MNRQKIIIIICISLLILYFFIIKKNREQMNSDKVYYYTVNDENNKPYMQFSVNGGKAPPNKKIGELVEKDSTLPLLLECNSKKMMVNYNKDKKNYYSPKSSQNQNDLIPAGCIPINKLSSPQTKHTPQIKCDQKKVYDCTSLSDKTIFKSIKQQMKDEKKAFINNNTTIYSMLKKNNSKLNIEKNSKNQQMMNKWILI